MRTGIIAHPPPKVNGFRVRGCETAPVSRLIRRGVLVGAVVGLAYATWRLVASRTAGSGGPAYEAQPFPMPPRPVPARPVPARPETGAALELPGADHGTDDAGDTGAVDPDDAGNCPVAFPIKGKLSTGIYHRPGAFAYDRTRADRCYRDESAAQSDGLRAAKR
jgi:hypothetical protein